jgi:DNA-binding IclR family transcriptional regulator
MTTLAGVTPVPQSRQHESAKRYQVRSVQRALTLLRTFLPHDGELSAAELSKETGLDPSTVFRLLVTLEAEGFVEVNRATSKYRPGVALLELGSRFLKNSDIRSRSIGYLERLRDEFGETVHLTILDGDEVVYLEKLAGLHPIGFMSSRVGDRNPAHCTGVGKALLAYLPDQELAELYPDGRLKRYTAQTITKLEKLRAELERVRSLGMPSTWRTRTGRHVLPCRPSTTRKWRRSASPAGRPHDDTSPTQPDPDARGSRRPDLGTWAGVRR